MNELEARLLLGAVNNPTNGEAYGVYRGFCVDNTDPDKLGRIRVYIPALHGEEQPDSSQLPWAWTCAPFGGLAGAGMALVPDEGASVWVLFECGKTTSPVCMGAWWGSPGGDPEIPDAVYQGGTSPVYDVLYWRDTKFIYVHRGQEKMYIGVSSTCFLELLGTSVKVHMGSSVVELTGTAISVTSSGTVSITAPVVNVSGTVNLG